MPILFTPTLLLLHNSKESGIDVLKNLILAEMPLQKRNKKIKNAFSCCPTGRHKIDKESVTLLFSKGK